jgi:hypothetical protein
MGYWLATLDTLTRYTTRLRAGRYNRETGVLLGFVAALLVAALGYLIGVFVNFISVETPQIPLQVSKLNLVWSVHATVISLSLVGLSFAWNSIRDLPTSSDIIEEITFRLHSIETITFLLASNLWIGAGILLVDGEYVSTEIAWAVGTLLVVSFVVTVRRFWTVFELLLHNTLDDTVATFADTILANKFDDADERYNAYLDHFFRASRQAIENDRPEQLSTKLSHVEDLLDDLLWHDGEVPDPEQLWRNALSNYESLHRRTIRQQNEELQRQLIKSLSGLFWISTNYKEINLVKRTLRSYSVIFHQGAAAGISSNAVEFLLGRFENAQMWILSQFEDADTPARLDTVSSLVDIWIETHALLWKTAVEQESTGALGYLHYLVNDVYQFRPYTYDRALPTQDANEGTRFNERKQSIADSYRNELLQLRFAAYGWALHLNTDNDLSDDFLAHIFTEYIESDFTSIKELSTVYFTLAEEAAVLKYWEQWNMNRELEQTHGAATTGMAANTWLLRFYCTAMIWVVQGDEEIQQLENRDPADSPITDHGRVQHRIDDIIGILDSYSNEFPLDELVSGDASIAERSEALVAYFKEVKSVLDKQEQKEIRELPIFDDAVRRFEDSVNSQLDSCGLRTGIEQVDSITSVDTLTDGEGDELTLYSTSTRRGFVDTGVPTFFSSSFSGIIDRYREFVLEHLDMEELVIESVDELPDLLAEIAAANDVEVFVVGLGDSSDAVRDDERSERVAHSSINSFYSFVDIPVIRDGTNTYVAVILFKDGVEYREQNDTGPFSVSVTPGEKIEDWTENAVPEGKIPADFVRIQYSYQADIQSSSSNGVIIRLAQ